MKILTIITLLSSILTGGITHNFSGHAENTYYEVNRTYFVDNYESEGTAVGGAVEYTAVYPVTFGMKVNIVFKKPIVSAQIVMEVTAAQSSLYNKWDYIGENCSVEWIDGTHYQIDCYNCSNATFILFASYNQVHNGYGFNRVSVQSSLTSADQWISYNTYFDIVSIQPTYTNNNANIVIEENPDYTNQLATLLSQTDGIENYLLQIYNLSSNIQSQLTSNSTTITTIKNTLNTINTNVNSIKTQLTNLYNLLDERFMTEDLYEALLQSAGQKVNNINVVLSNDHLTYLPTQFAYVGPNTPGYITIFSTSQEINTSMNKNSLKAVFRLSGYSSTPYYYMNIPIGTSSTNVDTTEELYIYNKPQNRIYVITMMIKYNDDTVSIYVQGRYRLTSNPLTSSGTNADTFTELYITDKPISTEEYLSALISTMQSSFGDIDITEDPNESTLSNFYESLKQNLQLPTVPANDPNILQKMKKITDPVIRMFNLGEFDIFKYMFNFGVLAMLFGVIFL